MPSDRPRTPQSALFIAVGAGWLAAAAGCGDFCQVGQAKCEGNTVYRCWAPEHGTGKWAAIEDCGASFCKSSAAGAVCSLSQQPDPACAASITSEIDARCNGSLQIRCGLGYLTGVGDDCLEPALCFYSLCSAVGEIHPVCGTLDEPNKYVRTTCYMNHVLICREGRLADMVDCGSGQCAAGPAPAAGATWCFPSADKCVPYAPEPLSACQ